MSGTLTRPPNVRSIIKNRIYPPLINIPRRARYRRKSRTVRNCGLSVEAFDAFRLRLTAVCTDNRFPTRIAQLALTHRHLRRGRLPGSARHAACHEIRRNSLTQTRFGNGAINSAWHGASPESGDKLMSSLEGAYANLACGGMAMANLSHMCLPRHWQHSLASARPVQDRGITYVNRHEFWLRAASDIAVS